LKQQELMELQRRGIGQPTAAPIPQLAVPEETRIAAQQQPVEKPIPTIRQSKSPAIGRSPAEVLVTNQMLKDMLRPLGKADDNEACSNGTNNTVFNHIYIFKNLYFEI
jgi:hypothetical protein